MSDINRVANSLAKARSDSNLSQKELANKLGLKQSQISELETGKRDMRISTLIEVARGVGLEVVLVPRALLPAVNYVLDTTGTASEQRSKYDSWEEDDE